jgi:hypothetical protein
MSAAAAAAAAYRDILVQAPAAAAGALAEPSQQGGRLLAVAHPSQVYALLDRAAQPAHAHGGRSSRAARRQAALALLLERIVRETLYQACDHWAEFGFLDRVPASHGGALPDGLVRAFLKHAQVAYAPSAAPPGEENLARQ